MQDYYKAALKDIAGATEKTFGEEMQDSMTGWASSFSGELNNLLWDSDATFGDVAKSFGRMLTQMVIQKQIVDKALSWTSNGENWKAAFRVVGSWFGNGPAARASSDAPSICSRNSSSMMSRRLSGW